MVSGGLFIETNKQDPDDAPPTDRLCDPNSIIYMLSMMLCFHAWYHYGAPYNAKTDVDVMSMQNSISEMLKHVKLAAPRSDKSGWNIQKFHDILHIPRDIRMYSSPMNYDASTSENNLKFFAKMPGEHTQKGTKMHIAQTCIRLRETDLMMKAISAYKHSYPSHFPAIVTQSKTVNGPVPNDQDAIASVLVGGPHFTVTMSPVDGQSQVKSHQGLKARTEREVHPVLIKYFVKLATATRTDFFGQNMFELYTEYKRDNRIIRAHPNYNSFGE